MAGDKDKGLICPIFQAQSLEVLKTARDLPKQKRIKCLENKCAWWEINNYRCSIKVIAMSLYKSKS